jgi:hypothetical protein
MAKTLVGYPDEPNRKTLFVAGALLTGVGGYVVARNREPIVRAAASMAVPLLTRPLAILLTRSGLI